MFFSLYTLVSFKTMGGESYTVIKIKMSITLLIKSPFLSVNSCTVYKTKFVTNHHQKMNIVNIMIFIAIFTS